MQLLKDQRVFLIFISMSNTMGKKSHAVGGGDHKQVLLQAEVK